MRRVSIAVPLLALVAALACGGGSMGDGGGPGLSLALSSSSAQVFQGDSSAVINLTLTRTGNTGNVTVTVSGAPSGATVDIQSPGSNDTGTVTIGPGTAAVGGSALTVHATDGSVSTSKALQLTVGASAQIANSTSSRLQLAMSTSFQPAEWDYHFFTNFPTATTPLGNLLPQHIRLQAISQGIPQKTATTWDFTIVDAIAQPVLGVADNSPEFQIAKGPPFMYTSSNSNNSFQDLTFTQFAGYTQDLVRYYNTGGFTASDGLHVSASPHAITWWGIYNEPNINNNLTPAQYVTMYNKVVPAMQAVDPSIKFAALELADFFQQPQNWVPTFVNGVTAQVDVMATHFYSTCNQADKDVQIFDSVPGFITDIEFFQTQMATKPALANVPIWVTENNVNADFDGGGGISACNGTPFVSDHRGSSAFFAAWRPYVFSQFGKAGVQALYHWDFDADAQFGEFNDSNGQLQLSYWTDYWLARKFASPPGADILQFSNTDNADLEVLPVRNDDDSVVIMVANRAVNAPNDNNGPGTPRSVQVDVSALGSFASASVLKLDATTGLTNGPTETPVTPASKIVLNFNGYGVAFLTLQ